MKYPKISIITPSYNQGKYIKDTIDSVLSQDYPNLEYLVVDGGSTDNTLEILQSYGNKLKWVSEKDHGQTDAINKGLRQSSGEILAYLNSDDIYLPGALKRVGEYYARTQADWITGDCLIIDSEGNTSGNNWLVSGYKRFLMRHYSPRLLKIVDNMLPQPSTFFSRRAYDKVGAFNQKLEYVMDYDYWLSLSKHFTPHDLGVALSGFRSQPESKSETKRAQLMDEGDQILASHGATRLELFLHRLHSDLVRFVYHLLK